MWATPSPPLLMVLMVNILSAGVPMAASPSLRRCAGMCGRVEIGAMNTGKVRGNINLRENYDEKYTNIHYCGSTKH